MNAYFSCSSGGYGSTAFQVVDGSTISEEYNETLDSATIRLAPISSQLSDIQPYTEVYLSQGSKSWMFLVDSFEETQLNNREDGKLYSYTISLMSMTKYLEKVQLPNICITHRENERDTLAEVIQRLFLYVPKIKMILAGTSWEYRRFLSLDEDGSVAGYGKTLAEQFEQPCADLQLSQPTLRQALTAIMTQVGCIPIVKRHTISWLDLRAEQEESGFDDTEIIVSRSQSSDSFVNTLVNTSGGLLDNTGKSVSERLCFRDRDNLLLQQLQNLKLETRFPIYKISRLIANAYFGGQTLRLGACDTWRYASQLNRTAGNATRLVIELDNNEFTIEAVEAGIYASSFSGYVYYAHQTTSSVSGVRWIVDGRQDVSFTGNTSSLKVISLPASWASGVSDGSHFLVVVGTMSLSGTNVIPTMNVFHGYSDASCLVQFTTSTYIYDYNTNNRLVFTEFKMQISASKSLDITKLCKEASARSGLSVDYTALGTIASGDVDTFAQYYYSTFEYQIGGNEITGFSQTYTITNGFWERTHSVIETICSKVIGWDSFYAHLSDSDAEDIFGGILDGVLPENSYTYLDAPPNSDSDFTTPIVIFEQEAHPLLNPKAPVNPYTGSASRSYATMFFDIEYQPIASPNLRFTRKDSGGIPIEQLDSKQNGLSSVERVSASEYETIARLGSDVVCIHQRVQNASDVVDLDTTYGEYTIFKRTICYRPTFLEVDYYASKNYVLKNYFTSIITKYRAYQYVDLSQAVTRQECLHTFLEIRDDGAIPQGSDLVQISIDGSATSNLYRPYDYLFADGFWCKLSDAEYPLCKSARKYADDLANYYLDEANITHSERFFAITALDFDNGSKGIYVDGTYISGTNHQSTDDLGGIPQRYYPAQGDLDGFAFCSKLPYFDVEASLDDVQALPKFPISYGFNPRYAVYTSIEDTPLSYKDITERLGETFDSEILNYADGFTFNENMISMSSMLNAGIGAYGVLIIPNVKLLPPDQKREIYYESGDFYYISDDGVPRSLTDLSVDMNTAVSEQIMFRSGYYGMITFNFAGFFNKFSPFGVASRSATICAFYLTSLTTGYLKDICRFEQKNNHTYKLMFRFNDTMGTDVYSFHPLRSLLIANKKVVLATSSTASADWSRKIIDK